ncbi:MAG: triose-phosphate isomerase [Candidatus Undinarchaeales archaeon]|jgi:triosephosphate isomerase|nr:triose-phosphate isomerase [Candidatus Undinarchaeales archaeon]MDP7491804.1 triose-phosphate isomerase [Candidatus Undinarchaeales archaeon]
MMDDEELAKVVRDVVLSKLQEKQAQDALSASPEDTSPEGTIPRHTYAEAGNPPLIVAANWKMHMDKRSTTEFAQAFDPPARDDLGVVICPPYYLLSLLKDALGDKPVAVGAQNMHPEPKGPFTGELSPLMLADAGCSHVILGHSERRKNFGETSEKINPKVAAALGAGLAPILCVGETLDQREDGATMRVVTNQLTLSLNRISINEVRPLIIAYEPMWAIGTGRNATPEQAQEVHAHIREVLKQLYSYNVARDTRILYGGSVKPDNAGDLAIQPDVDGFLVGGASLKPDSFTEIIRNALRALEKDGSQG